MFYGSNVWDPVLIIAQIISVQCLFYISLGLIQAVTIGPTLGYITVAYIFDWGTLHFNTKLGALNWMSHVVNAIAGAAVLAWVVERAKKCLDFSATCYIWHTLFVCWYSGWPRSLPWWLASGIGLLIMVLLGEWLCIRREMQDIPLSIPQRLGSGLAGLARRKESGQVVVPMMPLPTDDPDQPLRPRLRAGMSSLSRASAAATTAASSTSFSSASPGPAVVTSASPAQLPPAAARPGGAVQMTVLAGSSGSSSSAVAGGLPGVREGVASPAGSGLSRKKLAVRPASQPNLAVARQPAGWGAVQANGLPGTPAAAEAAGVEVFTGGSQGAAAASELEPG